MGKFVYNNENHKNKKTTDCVIRALKTVLDIDIKTIIYELTDIYIKTGFYISDPKCYDKYLTSKGYTKMKQPRHSDKSKFTAEEFCDYLNHLYDIKGDIVAHVGGHHITTFVNEGTEIEPNYKIYDIWDCSNKCVGNWWCRERRI